METNINYTMVGIFVIGLVAAIIMGIIWLSSGFSTADYKLYQVNMKEAVTGLSIEAPVEYNGVNVGVVENIQINHKNPQLVLLTLRVKSDTPVTQGTRAKLGIRALSGIAYILLEDKGTDMRPLVAQRGQPYPVISTVPSLLVRIDTALTQLNDSFHDLSESVRSLLDENNLHSVKKILTITEDTLESFKAQTIPATNKAIAGFGSMAHDITDVSNEIKQNPALLIRGRDPQALGPGEK